MLAFGALSLVGCHAVVPAARLALLVGSAHARGTDVRSETREEAAASFDCPPDDVELDSIADGYVAKGCGQFQHFTCRGESVLGWSSCTSEPPIRLPPLVTSRER
ncbi:MAG: hypothetical protein KIT84_34220 [Labilithrix sp.]|nr:hypothetical protein [Labilithrix sp.]MCW5816103.1 hypothetical protein [Labilithrix sp.]